MVILFQGPSGSGKSTLTELLSSTNFKFKIGDQEVEPAMTPAISYVKQLWNSFINREHKFYSVSSDYFFMLNGEYKFDVKLLGAAQTACLRQFYECVCDPKAVIVVDNTHTSIAEASPYIQLGNAFAHEVQVITLLPDPVKCAERNKHNVPFSKIVQQSLRLQESISNWPSFFPKQQIFPA